MPPKRHPRRPRPRSSSLTVGPDRSLSVRRCGDRRTRATRCYGSAACGARTPRRVCRAAAAREVDKGVDVIQLEDGLAIDVYVIVSTASGSRKSRTPAGDGQVRGRAIVNVPVVQVNVNVQGVARAFLHSDGVKVRCHGRFSSARSSQPTWLAANHEEVTPQRLPV